MSSPSPSPESASERVMSHFRGDNRAPLPLHPLEKALVIIAGAQLVFMPWALGAMYVWGQAIALGLAALGFIVALIPRHYTSDYAREGEFRLLMWPKLVRFPIFWLGLALLTYITIQALNPAYGYVEFPNGSYTFRPVDHITWLPTGIEAPFAKMNAWRMLIIYAGAWLLACSLWVGLTRRNAVQAVLATVAISGAVLGLVAILQRVTGTTDILWFIKGKPWYFVGTIMYKHHAGAYFNLVVTIAAALALWHYHRSVRRHARNSPAPLFAFCGLIAGIVVLITYSRAATILLLAFTLIGIIVFFIWLFSAAKGSRNNSVIFVICGVFAVFAVFGGYFLKFDQSVDGIEKIIGQIQRGEGQSVSGRQLAAKATWDMLTDKSVTGWGAGGFRWIFPSYQQFYPEIFNGGNPNGGMFFWEYAHNDYLQGIAELGVFGALLGLGLIATGVINLVRHGGLTRPPILLLVGGLLMTLAHSTIDFNFYNPAVLCTWTAMLVLTGRWAELENRR